MKRLRFLAILLSLLWSACLYAQCQEQDYLALRALYISTGGDSWTTNTNWPNSIFFLQNPTMPFGTNMGSWYGVRTNLSGCVTCLDLSGANKCNPINTGIGNGNNLSGSIPSGIGNLSDLQTLYLQNNNLSGSIPSSIGNLSKLETLHLHSNQLSGNIPIEIGNLTNLIELHLHNNQLSGSIPSSIGNLSKLETLHLDNNQLTGNIPTMIENLDNLTNLSLFANDISGNIPTEIGNLVNLEFLSLNNNQLSDTIPTEIGNLVNLIGCSLENNQLNGPIPAEIGNLSSLKNLYLSNNQLTGEIPTEIGDLNLERLSLHDNQLNGCYNSNLNNLCSQLIPMYNNNSSISSGNELDAWEDFCTTQASICLTSNCQEQDYIALRALYLSTGGDNWTDNTNWLTEAEFNTNPIMPAGTDVGTWHGVTTDVDGCVTSLSLSYNNFSGSIPPELGNLNSLTYLRLDNNNLSGSIPPELGNLNNLTYLNLYNNNLSGNIPIELGNLNNLESFYLFYNNLSGSIPPELGNLNNLTGLRLYNNNLSGSIPPELGNLNNLIRFNLSRNNLSGGIPPELGNLNNLMHLWLDTNNLSGCYDFNLSSLCMQLSNDTNQYISDGNNFDATWEDFCATQAGICTTTPSCHEQDYIALRALYLSTDGDNWTDTTGWFSADEFMANLTIPAGTNVGTWYGVTTDIDGCVTCIDMDGNPSCSLGDYGGNNLTGTIPFELSNLSNLTDLFLSNNQLSGSIPSELGDLSNLTDLNLSDNQLSDGIPSELGNLSKLIYLRLSSNNLSNSIPLALGNLSNLTSLYLSFNNLSGSIPVEISNLDGLIYLSLSKNQLNGGIPPELNNLSNLTYLSLANNQLSGCYDSSLSNLCSQLDNGTNYYISDGNNFDTTWEDFCQFGTDACLPCEITPENANISCDDAGTPNDSTDDLFTFDITINGSNPTGANTFNDSEGSTDIPYSTTITYGPYLISNGDIMISFQDTDDTNCTNDITISPPASCSICIDLVLPKPPQEVDAIKICEGDTPQPIIASDNVDNSCVNWSWYDQETGGNFIFSEQNYTPSQANIGVYSYYVSCIDNNGCESTREEYQYIISAPPKVIYTSVAETLPGMSDGSISICIQGGTPDYIITTMPDITLSQVSDTCDANFEANNLTSGAYIFNIADNNGCTLSDTIDVSVGMCMLNIDAVVINNHVSCFNGNDGRLTIYTSQGTGDYQFSIDNGNNFTTSADPSYLFDNLIAGNHNIVVMDDLGCTATFPNNPVTVEQPNELGIIGLFSNDVSQGADNGSIVFCVVGGTPPYQVTHTEALGNVGGGNGCSMGESFGIYDLPADTYTITITDANDCTYTSEAITINGPLCSLIININADNNISCNGGSDGQATATASDGTLPYTYQWSAGANNQTTATATNLSAGMHTVTITDANACEISGEVSITEPPSLTLNLSSDDVTCVGGNTGFAEAMVEGGTPDVAGNYTYQWSANTGGQTTPNVFNLSAGTYTVTVTDANTCQISGEVSITEPDILSTNISTTDASCGNADGTATVTVSGGIPPYTYYQWDDPNNQITETATDLAAGTYNVTVADVYGCTVVGSTDINDSGAPTATATSTDASCGNADGTATVTATSGTPSYTYQWDDPNNQTTSTAIGLEAGTYNVTITDMNNCTAVANITVNAPAQININAITTDSVSCFNENDGQLTIYASQGMGDYQFSIDNGNNFVTTPNSTYTFDNLNTGNYDIIVMDDLGCIDTFPNNPVIIEQPNGLSIIGLFSNDVSQGTDNGSIVFCIAGGTPPYQVTHTEALGNLGIGIGCSMGESFGIYDLPADTYTITITDANDCTYSFMATINGPDDCNTTSPQTCDDGDPCTEEDMETVLADGTICEPCTGTRMTCDTGATEEIPCDDGDPTTINDIEVVLICDNNIICEQCMGVPEQEGCDSTDLIITDIEITNPSFCVLSDGEITILIEGGTPPYQYSINGGDFRYSNTLDGLIEDIYIIIARDSESCTTTETIALMNEGQIPNINIPVGIMPNSQDEKLRRLEIKNLDGECFDETRLIIFNRWGDPVYKMENYGIRVGWSESDWWDGTCNIGICKGKLLPQGTYYYVLYLNSGKPQKGSVFIL